MDMLQGICERERFDLIVGSSCGSFYGQQLVRLTGIPALLVSPFFKMTKFLEPRIGIHQYKSQRIDGQQYYEITEELVREFAKRRSINLIAMTSITVIRSRECSERKIHSLISSIFSKSIMQIQ